MAVGDIVPVSGTRFEDTLESASPDLLREMIKGFAQRMMDAEVEGICGAGYGEVSPDRVNSRNGYRRREWDTRAGTVELAVPGAEGAPADVMLFTSTEVVYGVTGTDVSELPEYGVSP